MTPIKLDPDDPQQEVALRVLAALRASLQGDEAPRLVAVLEVQPDGAIGVLAPGDDALDAFRMLLLGIGACFENLEGEPRAIALHQLHRATARVLDEEASRS